MKFNIFLILVISVNCYLAQWTLVWNDEFDSNQLDYNKWSVTDGKDILEAPESEIVLSYSRDNNYTIQLKNGLLGLTVVQKNNFDRNFMSATINSKMAFHYGRVDVRAALPQGMNLKTAIVLQPVNNNKYGDGYDRASGEIELVADLQYGYYYSRISHKNMFDVTDSYPFSDDFQVYSVHWNKTEITWSSNDTLRRIFNLDRLLDSYYKEKGQPFDQKFYLSIRLQVQTLENDPVIIDDSFYKNWKCPLLLIDYVRIYQKLNSTQLKRPEENLLNSDETKENICQIVDRKLSQFYADSNLSSTIENIDNSDYVLVWNDEFNGNRLDYHKWSVTNGKDILEAPAFEEVLSHSRDNEHNIQLSNGILALIATQESYQGRNFTTATINSKMSFIYGRLDLRAALPFGALLKTAIVLLPEKNEYGQGRDNGEIELVAHLQLGDYYSRVSYHDRFDAIKTYPAIDNFQVYTLDWNQTQITWLLDGSVRRIFKLDEITDSYYKEKGQPFDKRFYLSILLQVMKFKGSDIDIDDKYHQKWNCSSLLIDYVRLYQRAGTINSTDQLQELLKSNESKVDICRTVNNKLQNIYKYNDKIDLSSIWNIGVPVFSLLVSILLIIVVIALIKQRNRLASSIHPDRDNNLEVYDEIGKVNAHANNYVIDRAQPGPVYDDIANEVNEQNNLEIISNL